MPHDRFVPHVVASEPLPRVVPAFVIGLILAEVGFGPHSFQKCCEPLVEPDVPPILAGDQIAEPLVPELVGDQVVFSREIFGSQPGMNKRSARVGCSAGILHAAGNEVIHHDLRVFFPRIIDAKFFAEQLHHCWSAAIVDREAVATSLGRVVGNRDAAPGLFHFVKLTGDHSDQVGGTEDGLLPIPGLQTLAGVGDTYQFAVGNRDPRCGNGENRFGREPVVRVVVSRKIVARVFRFALGPDLFRAIRIVLVRQNEIHSLCRLAFVADRDFKFVAGFSLSGEGNDQLLRRRLEFCNRFIDRHLLNGEPDRVENDFRSAVAKNG